ncbi:uncharacterized protein LOC118463772 [Anopheles albimanus]|uniref:uncharacterized protein LOC118463772 n=1 Tax=Anopheles albimanus TaxID=7167 RepID=UPI001641EABD|nr:uncharacterized protein LOC118463772 [Anopheles albimanus]
MDELMEVFSSFIGEALLSERNMEEEFKELERKVNQCVKQATERGTPVQNKKRPKRHASLSEKDESDIKDEDSSVVDHGHTSSSRGSANRMLDVAPSDEPMVAEEVMTDAVVPSMPPPPVPVAAVAVEKAARPSRTARLKAQEKLKEPSLVEKMRNPNASIKVKIERSSTVANSSSGAISSHDKSLVDKNVHKTTIATTKFDEMEVENDANRMNRMDNVVPPIDELVTTQEGKGKNATEDHHDAGADVTGKPSLMVIQQTVPKVEIVSDEEMPPPKVPAPKPVAPRTGRGRGRPPKASKTKNTIQPDDDTTGIVEPVRIKTEKLSIVDSSESTFTVADPPLRPLNVVLEKMAMPKGTPPSAATTATTSPAMGASDHNGTYLLEAACPKGTPPSATMTTSAGMGAPDANGTYLVETTFSKETPQPTSTSMAPDTETADPNGTFAIPTSSSGNNRWLPSVQDGTFVIAKNDSSSEPNSAERMHLVNASIMTEDDSVIENSPQQPAPLQGPVVLPTVKPSLPKATTEGKSKKASTTGTLKKSASSNALGSSARNATTALADNGKKHKELFNPCVQSPIKSRIEAFEKCAFGSTMATKASSGTPQIARIMKTASTPTLTPHATAMDGAGYGAAGVRSANAARPMMGSTVTTPNITTQPITKASSASKISQMRSKMLHQHTTHSGAANGAGARGPLSLSREPSWDRAATATPSTSGTLSAASSTSSLLDEKKKKREEKQRIAAEQRETKEREKREHMERLRREKEEKYQKLLQEKQEKIRLEAAKKARKLEEFEKRRQQEEQRALADQKRDELAKQLEQQRIDRELLEALKQNQMMKENTEIKLQKQMHQQKLRQQQQQQAAAAAAAKKKAAASAGGRRVQQFTFDMIETDDSTDEDEPADASKKNKRPPLPEWCRNVEEYRKVLLIQSKVDTKVIDRLFSVQPTTPDLRELFPSIDAHKLKRNSSAIWRTPPRASQIP